MANLKKLRREIDEVDKKILGFIADRVKICEEVGMAKKAQGLPVRDEAREAQVFNHIREQATKLGLDPVRVEAVYREIVNMCSSVQE